MTTENITEKVQGWLNNDLSPEEEWEVAEFVEAGGAWRDAYNEALQMFKNVHFTRSARRDSLRVAVDEHETKQAIAFGGLCLNMPMPHKGGGASLLAVRTPEGILFFTDIPNEEQRCRLAPYGTKTFRWCDRVLDITFTMHEHDFGLSERMRHAANDVCQLAYGTGHSRAIEHCLNVIEDLQGYWVDVLANASHAFEEALEDTEDLEQQVMTLLSLRIHLGILARRLNDPALDFALDDADALLAPHKSGLLLLDERTYTRFIEGVTVKPESWWGFPLLLEEQVPRHLVLQTLKAMRD